jgi:hypothetical protein
MSKLNDGDLLVAQLFEVWHQIDNYYCSHEFLESMSFQPLYRLASQSLSISKELHGKYRKLLNEKKLASYLRLHFVIAKKLDNDFADSYNFEHPRFM